LSNSLETTEVAETDSQKSVPVNEANDQLANAANASVTQALDQDGETDLTDAAGKAVVLRAGFVAFTGALTGGEDVLLPAVDRIFWVLDSTTGGQTVTVKASGQTGEALTAAKPMLIRFNGTDYEKIIETP